VRSSPLLRTIQDLSALARLRGDAEETRLLARAAEVVGARGITSDADLGPLVDGTSDVADVDKAVVSRLRHMYDAGAWVILESSIVDVPADLRWLFESGAVSLTQLAELNAVTGATTAADLGDLLRNEGLRYLPAFGAAAEATIGHALTRLRQAIPRLTLGRAVAVSEPVLETLRSYPGVEWAEPAGSVRRGQDTVGDIEIVVSFGGSPSGLFDAIMGGVPVSRCLHRSARRLYVLVDSTQVGIRVAEPSLAGATLLYLTGGHAHIDELHARARRLGWTFSTHGLDRADGRPPVGRTEKDVYDALSLQWIPAEIREGGDELRAAETGTLPTLIKRSDIRGDLHIHTDYSDGRDSVAVMVKAAEALGYEYIAITDHSPHSAASRNLTIDSVKRQADDIADLRERYPQLAILHGCEVDILPDERLDFSDRILERFDIVLASLHDAAGHDPGRLLRRYLMAMRHPLVAMVTHPTNRLVPSRPGYELDYEQLFAAAVETGTMVEVDGGPSHLDLDGALARRAVLAGAMLAVDSDSHRAEALARQMALGIQTARRGWVEARHVMNTRSVQEIRALIAGKRSR
jgi:DNA polymerase (family X)